MNTQSSTIQIYRDRGIRYLYKYLKIDNYLFENLKNLELWFSNPIISFNDPYDCQIGIETSASKEQIENYIQRTIKRVSERLRLSSYNQQREFYEKRGIANNQIVARIEELINGSNALNENELEELKNAYITDPISLKENLNSELIKQNENLRILCLSQAPNNILMWSHYADSHKGVMIMFDVYMDSAFFNKPIFVDYSVDYPAFNLITNQYSAGQLFDHAVGTKYIEWEYESEVRIVKSIYQNNFRNNGLLGYKKEVLKEIVFGINACASDIDKVVEIIKRYYGNNVIIKKAIKDETSYVPLIKTI